MACCSWRDRHQDGHLLAVGHRQEGRPQRHFGLPVADVPAHQSVHGVLLLHVVEHLVDSLELVRGFLVGEPGLEVSKIGVRGTEGEPVSHLALRVKLQQLAGHLLGRALDALLGALPGRSAETVEGGGVPLHPEILLHHAHAVHRQVELVPSLVDQRQEIVAHPFDRQLLQTVVLPDAVVGVHDEVPLLELLQVEQLGAQLACRFTAMHPARPEDLVLGHDRQSLGRPHETAAQAPQAECRHGSGAAGRSLRSFELEAVGGEQRCEALRLRPGSAGDQHPPAGSPVLPDPVRQRLQHLLLPVSAPHGGGQLAVALNADVHATAFPRVRVSARLRQLEELEPGRPKALQPRAHFLPWGVEPLRGDAELAGVAAGGVAGPHDLLELRGGGVLAVWVDADAHRLAGQVVQKSFEIRIDQRQQAIDARERFLVRQAGGDGAQLGGGQGLLRCEQADPLQDFGQRLDG